MKAELREALLDQLNNWLTELCDVEDAAEQCRIAQKHSKQLGLLTLSSIYEFMALFERHFAQYPGQDLRMSEKTFFDLMRPVRAVALAEAKARLTARTGETVWDIPGPGTTCILEEPILEEIEG